MKSAIITLKKAINNLEIEQRVWSEEPNKDNRVLNDIRIEKSEHLEALNELQKIRQRKCKNHLFRILKPEEIKEKNIKSKGIGIWICIECDKIKHSM